MRSHNDRKIKKKKFLTMEKQVFLVLLLKDLLGFTISKRLFFTLNINVIQKKKRKSNFLKEL